MPTNTQLHKIVLELKKEVEALKVAKLEKEIEVLETEVEEPKKENKLNLEIDNEMPIPENYKKRVHEILNKEFGIAMGYGDNGIDFNILVPEKYSTMNPDAKKMAKVDRRRKIIAQSEGENGVKDYSELVFKSFNPTVQAMIVADRTQ